MDVSRKHCGICQTAFCLMVCVTLLGQDRIKQHYRFFLRQKLKRQQLPFYQLLQGIFLLSVLILLPVVQAVCSSTSRFVADQAHKQKRYVALAGTQVRLTCSHDASAVQQCAVCFRGVKRIKAETFEKRQLSFTEELVSNTYVERDDLRTVVTIRNASKALTGYYWCSYCLLPANDSCLAEDKGSNTAVDCASDTLNLVIVDELPSLTSKLCCAMSDDSLNCSFGQNLAGVLHDTATTWNISYLFSDINGSDTASCRSESCFLQLPRHASLRSVNYTFVVTSNSLLGGSTWTSTVYTDHSVERLPSVHGLQIEAVGSTALRVRWQGIAEKQRTSWADKLEKYGVEYTVAYWPKNNRSSRQVNRFLSYNMSLQALLEDLTPSVTYSVEVRSRLGASALDCTWSSPSSVESTTLNVPVLMPNCLRDAFSIWPHPHAQQRNITIFWKASSDAEIHPDGQIESYLIAWHDGNVTISGASRSATLTFRTGRAYDVTLSAKPSLSKLTTTVPQACVHIPNQPLGLDLPHCRLSAESVNDSTVKVSWTWSAPAGKTFLYTVFWCAASSNDLCEGDIQSAPAHTKWALVALPPNSSALLYRFGVAASDNTDHSASGIVWAPCVNSNVTEPVLLPPNVTVDPSSQGHMAIRSTDALLIGYQFPCISGAPRISDLKLHYCVEKADACQGEAQVVTLDACQTETAINVDSHQSHLFWLSGRSGSERFNSTSVMRAASLAVRSFYWMVPVAVALTVAAAALAVALYKLQKSIKNVQTIAHIPRSSEEPEAARFLGASASNLHTEWGDRAPSKVDGTKVCRLAHNTQPVSYIAKLLSSGTQSGGSCSGRCAAAGSDSPEYLVAESLTTASSIYVACLPNLTTVDGSSSDSQGSECQRLSRATAASADGSLQYVAASTSEDSLHYVATAVCQLRNST